MIANVKPVRGYFKTSRINQLALILPSSKYLRLEATQRKPLYTSHEGHYRSKEWIQKMGSLQTRSEKAAGRRGKHIKESPALQLHTTTSLLFLLHVIICNMCCMWQQKCCATRKMKV